MTYSVDLRQRVINYVNNGGNVKEAKKLFNIGKATIYRWLGSPTLVPKKVETLSRKLNRVALENDVKENPDISIKERAKKFNVSPSAICYAFKKMNITRKKKLRYRERNREERIKYYRLLRELIKIYGSDCLVYIDEAGFEEIANCIYAYAKKGKKVYGEKQGKRVKRENLVAGRNKKKKDFIAPMIFTGSLNGKGCEGWLEKYLIPSLKKPSILIMDNAPIHRKTAIGELVEASGHKVVFLPKYSPDLNDPNTLPILMILSMTLPHSRN